MQFDIIMSDLGHLFWMGGGLNSLQRMLSAFSKTRKQSDHKIGLDFAAFFKLVCMCWSNKNHAMMYHFCQPCITVGVKLEAQKII